MALSLLKQIKNLPNRVKRIVVAVKELITITLPTITRMYFLRILEALSEDVANVRLVKKSVAAFLYFCFFSGLLLTVLGYDTSPLVNKLIHPENGTEIIGVSSMLLALLLPVAILIIQDSKDSLLRRTVVKNIIQLNRLPIIVAIISATLFIPDEEVIIAQIITLRAVGGALAITCFVYIVVMLLKSYRWISDGAEASEGFSAPPSPKDPDFNYPNQFVSYRFAQIVRFLNETTSHEAWTQLWGKWWPSSYDNVLHQAFFKRHKDILSKNKTKKYNLANNELTAYRRNIDQRILEDYSYSSEYLSEFLEIYSLMHEGTKFSPKQKNLYAANNAVAAIIREIIAKNMTTEKIYFVASAIEDYVLKRYDKKAYARDTVLTNFITELLDAIFKDQISYYELKSSINSYSKRWGVSNDTVFENPQTISLTLVNTFWGWFKETVKNIDPDDTNFGMGNVLKFVFPTSDTITLGYLYWYLYVSENTFDETEGLKEFMTAKMSFVLVSNTETEFVPAGSEKDSLDRFREQLKKQQDEAIGLFANLYKNYLLRTRNLDNLISVSEQLASDTSSQRHAQYIQHLAEIFKEIKSYYQNIPGSN